MMRTTSERYYLHAANRHMETRRNRHKWRRRLAQARYSIGDWFLDWWN